MMSKESDVSWHCVHCGTPLFRMVMEFDGVLAPETVLWLDSVGATWSKQDPPCLKHEPDIGKKMEEAREVFRYMSKVVG